MSLVSYHEMSHASCLNLEVYIEVMRDPWQKVCNLFIVVCFLFESLKQAPNYLRNASKSITRGD
jgi:hypothetical protein